MNGSTSHSELKRRMNVVARAFRSRNPLSELTMDAGAYYLPTGYPGRQHFKPLVWFPSRGCVWSLSGGCTMCNFGQTSNPGDDEHILREFDKVLADVGLGVERIHLGPGGSFFTDAEVPADLRVRIIERLKQLPFLRSVGIETRAPFVTFDRLAAVISAMPSTVTDVTLGFGLETLSEAGRIAVNKGYGPAHVLKAVDTMADVQRHFNGRVNLRFETYVLLKPLFFTEGEAINEAVSTATWAYDQGAETVALFLNTVKDNTIQQYLSRAEIPGDIRYRPPFLRSAVETLRQLREPDRARTVVLGPQSVVRASGLPRTCELCDWPINGILVAHNLYRDRSILDDIAASSCRCKPTWTTELAAPETTVEERISAGLDLLERDFIVRSDSADMRSPSRALPVLG